MVWQLLLRWLPRIMLIAIAGAATYTISTAIIKSEQAFQHAISLAAYTIPLAAYALTLQLVLQMIGYVREMMGWAQQRE